VVADQGQVLVGAPEDTVSGRVSGSIHLFDIATGDRLARLLPVPRGNGDRFGKTVLMNESYIVASAPNKDLGGLEDTGWVFVYDRTTYESIHVFRPEELGSGDRFGVSIAIHEDMLLIGASRDDDLDIDAGVVYLYDLQAGTQVAKLYSPEPQRAGYFGKKVAIDDRFIAVSASPDGIGGVVYIYDRETLEFVLRLDPTNENVFSRFGSALSLEGGFLLVGSIVDSTVDFSAGSAYIYALPAFDLVEKVLPEDGDHYDYMGNSAAIDGGMGLVGATDSEFGGSPDPGYARLYDLASGKFLGQLEPSDGAENDLFGRSVDIDGDFIVIGSVGDDDAGSRSGSLYIYERIFPCNIFDTAAPYWELDFFDIIGYLNSFSQQEPWADLTGDGRYNFFDFSAFVSGFAGGCP
jgi:WD40 repeat protein